MAQKKPTVYEFVPKLGQLRDDVLFGDVWEHPDLSKRDRSCACGSVGGRRAGSFIATEREMPARSRFLTAERVRSWSKSPGRPESLHAAELEEILGR